MWSVQPVPASGHSQAQSQAHSDRPAAAHGPDTVDRAHRGPAPKHAKQAFFPAMQSHFIGAPNPQADGALRANRQKSVRDVFAEQEAIASAVRPGVEEEEELWFHILHDTCTQGAG